MDTTPDTRPATSSPTRDLRTIARIFWRWRLLFLVLLVTPAIGAYLVGRNTAKVYRSSTLVALGTSPADALSGQGVASPQNAQTVAGLITTRSVARTAARLLARPRPTPAALLANLTASANPVTSYITISARDRNPQRAAAIANAFAAALSPRQTQAASDRLDRRMAAVASHRRSLPARDLAARTRADEQLIQLRGLRAADSQTVTVLQAATPTATPLGLPVRRDVEIGLLIGFLLAIGGAVSAENSDRRIRTPDDVERITGVPLLGLIPRGITSKRLGTAQRLEEAFSMLRSALTYSNVDRRMASVAIVSPGGGDGKTTVAVGLALAAARAGQRTILLDADLRRPQVAARLGLSPREGLAAVVTGELEIADAIVEVPIEMPEGGSLHVLQAGPPPPHPAALLASAEMRDLIVRLERRSDLVVIDTAAALVVGDALPLAGAVSGVVLVIRMDHNNASALQRLQKVIISGHATVLGAVANGVPVAEGYGYGREYAANGVGQIQRRGLRKRQQSNGLALRPTAVRGTGESSVQGEESSFPPESRTTSS